VAVVDKSGITSTPSPGAPATL
jgi:hypothetical protein